MRKATAFLLLITPGVAFARSNTAGALWVVLSLPLAGLIASAAASVLGRKGEVDLTCFLIGLFIATPIVTGLGLWFAKTISAAFVALTAGIPTWVIWSVAIAVLVGAGHVIEYREKKRKVGHGQDA